MTEQENELLEMYIEYIRKRNLIIFIIVFIVVALGVFGLYKFKTFNNNVEEANVIEEVIKEENIIKEEVKVENNVEIKEQKVEENTQTQNIENTAISNEKIEIEKKEEDKKPTSTTNTKENTTNNVTNNTTNNTNAIKKPSNRDFLFTEGYTMENVTQAAQDYLKSSGHAGKCVPIQDKDGIYLGMRVIFD